MLKFHVYFINTTIQQTLRHRQRENAVKRSKCVRERKSRTFAQLQSISKTKRKHTWDIPLMLGGWGSVGIRTQRRPERCGGLTVWPTDTIWRSLLAGRVWPKPKTLPAH